MTDQDLPFEQHTYKMQCLTIPFHEVRIKRTAEVSSWPIFLTSEITIISLCFRGREKLRTITLNLIIEMTIIYGFKGLNDKEAFIYIPI